VQPLSPADAAELTAKELSQGDDVQLVRALEVVEAAE
jgi:hypothetical protein